MAIQPKQLSESILADELKFVNFFNGRMLSGEDLTREQLSNREARRLLGNAIGNGIAHGLEIEQVGDQPTLKISQGLAINRAGHVLHLDEDIELALVKTATVPPTGQNATFFNACNPLNAGVYVAGAGMYLLVVTPAVANQGRAAVSGLGNIDAACNTRYLVEGVRFRLVPVPLSEAELADQNRLRNLVAYKCFGVDSDLQPFVEMPFGSKADSYGLVDELREKGAITDCDVPLGMISWTARGIQFIDMWSVRRRIVKPSPVGEWNYVLGDRRRAEAEAMFLQFQEQIKKVVSPQLITGATHFQFLPPVGVLPLSDPVHSYQYKKFFEKSTDNLRFFQDKVYRSPVVIEGAKIQSLIVQALAYPPIEFSGKDMLWLYLVRENLEPLQGSAASLAKPFLIFTSGHVPFVGEARFDLSRWDYANYT